MKKLQFSLITKQVPVELANETGKVVTYSLREMVAEHRDQYMQEFKGRLEVNEEGNARGVRNFLSLQADLLALCLYDDKGERVRADVIQKWPASVVQELYTEARRLNSLDQDTKAATAAAKNG